MVTKRQHYVPRMYLRLFADEKNKVSYYDKVQNKVINNVRVEGVNVESYFYDFTDEFVDSVKAEATATNSLFASKVTKQFLEDYFATLEGEMGTVFSTLNQKLQNHSNLIELELNDVLTEEEKVAIALFFVLQSIRTPAAIAKMSKDTKVET